MYPVVTVHLHNHTWIQKVPNFLPSVDSQPKIFVGVNKLCQSDGDRVG